VWAAPHATARRPYVQPITLEGRAALERFVGGMFASVTIEDWALETTTLQREGHLAYAAGDERLVAVAKKTGKEDAERSHFLVVLREQPDGRWLVAYGMETPLHAQP
jgi:ketosteroid isomerase-like protein